MNNKFDFKRFGQVLAKDWKDYFRDFGISLIVWSCIPVLFWIVTLIFGFDMDNDSRTGIIACLMFLALLFVPAKVYGKANLSREGVSFATLPATHSEKFFSMVLYCSILTPLIVGLGSWAIDSLLYMLPFGGFSNSFLLLPTDHEGVILLVTIACYVLLVSSIFMFGNMIFKKGKTGKTIAWTLLIVFVIHIWRAIINWEISINLNALPWIEDGVMLVFAVALYYLTYRRIKNQKY